MKENQEQEQWKQVPGFPMYLVSDQGRVMSLTNPKKPKIMKHFVNRQGYHVVCLTSGEKRADETNKKKWMMVHRLVLTAFKGEAPAHKPFSDHISTNKDDNSVENLRWVNSKENSANPLTVQHHTQAMRKNNKRYEKPVYVYDEQLVQVSAFTSTAEASRQLNKSQGNIASCCTGALPRYLGLIWSYEPLTSISQRQALEQEKEYQKERNRKSTLKAAVKWQNNHKDLVRKWQRDYYYRHREKIIEYGKAYYRRRKNGKDTTASA